MTEDEWNKKMRRARNLAATFRGYQVKHGWIYVVELSPEGEERHV